VLQLSNDNTVHGDGFVWFVFDFLFSILVVLSLLGCRLVASIDCFVVVDV
jgi:hypothetical protein